MISFALAQSLLYLNRRRQAAIARLFHQKTFQILFFLVNQANQIRRGNPAFSCCLVDLERFIDVTFSSSVWVGTA